MPWPSRARTDELLGAVAPGARVLWEGSPVFLRPLGLLLGSLGGLGGLGVMAALGAAGAMPPWIAALLEPVGGLIVMLLGLVAVVVLPVTAVFTVRHVVRLAGMRLRVTTRGLLVKTGFLVVRVRRVAIPRDLPIRPRPEGEGSIALGAVLCETFDERGALLERGSWPLVLLGLGGSAGEVAHALAAARGEPWEETPGSPEEMKDARAFQRRRASVRRAIVASLIALGVLACVEGALLHAAEERRLVRPGNSPDFWRAACGVDIATKPRPLSSGYDQYFDRLPGDRCVYHDDCFFEVDGKAAFADFAAVVRKLEAASAGPSSITSGARAGFAAWRASELSQRNADTLLGAMRTGRIDAWNERQQSKRRLSESKGLKYDVAAAPYASRDARCRVLIERARRWNDAVAFEAAFFAVLVLVIAWPWIRRASYRRIVLHACAAHVLLFVPFWLGYAAASVEWSEGGVLLDRVLCALGRPLTVFANELDPGLLEQIPHPLDALSQSFRPEDWTEGSPGPLAVLAATALLGAVLLAVADVVWLASRPYRERRERAMAKGELPFATFRDALAGDCSEAVARTARWLVAWTFGMPEGHVRPHDLLDDYGRWKGQPWGPRVAYALGVYFPSTAGVDVDEVTTVRRLALFVQAAVDAGAQPTGVARFERGVTCTLGAFETMDSLARLIGRAPPEEP